MSSMNFAQKSLLQAPDWTTPKIEVLRRFRAVLAAITGDVRGIFLDLKVSDEDENAQRCILH